MAYPLTTNQVCKLLGIRYYQIAFALRVEKFAPPRKNARGEYQWYPQDVTRARQALGAKEATVAS